MRQSVSQEVVLTTEDVKRLQVAASITEKAIRLQGKQSREIVQTTKPAWLLIVLVCRLNTRATNPKIRTQPIINL
jgi:hypothetical protein